MADPVKTPESLHLPAWALQDEDYHPGRDRDAFISRSLVRIVAVLSALRRQGCLGGRGLPAVPTLLATVLLVVMVVASHTATFLWTVFALVCVLLALLPGQTLRRVLAAAVMAALFSALLVVPSLFLGNSRYVLLLPCKTFLTVTLLLVLREKVSWHALTGALRVLHLPSLVIFLLDTALRYIRILGEEAESLLTALTLRSVGRNRQKGATLGGVAGILFQKSQHHAQELYEAMVCRGFTGDYLPDHAPTGRGGARYAVLFLLVVAGFLCLFLRTEGVL